ncbi:MAG: histidine-type phosphatase, partial [Muribaculaceae bacterium]
RGLFAIAGDLQNTETGISLYDIFTADELFDLWQIGNFYNYVTYGPAPVNGGLIAATAKNLLSEIIESADKAIADGGNGATLRFGHDGNITPLVALMHLEGGYGQQTNPDLFYSAWCNFQVSPMASNVQIVFFRNKAGDVLVKFLHNEREVAIPIDTDIAPYYHWNRVKAYFKDILSSLAAIN